MASRHLLTIKARCLNADILGKTEQREALGWALARISEISGTRIADALHGRPSEAVAQEMSRMQEEIARLDLLIDHICRQTRADRGRMEATFQTARGSHG